MTQCDLLVAGSPTLLLVVQISAMSVIVEWSQPSGGATVTEYVVHYSDGINNMTERVPASFTSHSITNLTRCSNYTFSVEATSEHISGLSRTVELSGECMLFANTFMYFSVAGTSDLSVNVTAEAESSTVISVQWDHLRACGPVSHLSVKFSVKYTAVFSAASEVINQPGELIVSSTKAMLTGLTPFTNYSIIVAIVNEMGNVGPFSYPITYQTLEDGK